MPAVGTRDAASPTASGRRSVVPASAGSSLWRAAAWTGAAAFVVPAAAAIVAVAVCWLPVAGNSGSAGKAVRAGLLMTLSGLQAGITVSGVATSFVPLGLTLALAAVGWRAGTALADVAADLGEQDPSRLMRAAVLQAVTYAISCAIAATLATIGTSHVDPWAVLLAAALLFAATGGVGVVARSPLRELLPDLRFVAAVGRVTAVAVAVPVLAGSLLAAASLAVHHATATSLSAEVGGGWSDLPVLGLGVLAAPNAVVAAVGYLSGPGFAVGGGVDASLLHGARGTLPAFPVLAGVPRSAAGWPVWVLLGLSAVGLGLGVAVTARRCAVGSTGRVVLAAAVTSAAVWSVIAALAGGSAGSGTLAVIGVSPWRLGLVMGGATGLLGGVAAAGLALVTTSGDSAGSRLTTDRDTADVGTLTHVRRVDADDDESAAAEASAGTEESAGAEDAADDGAPVVTGPIATADDQVEAPEDERLTAPLPVVLARGRFRAKDGPPRLDGDGPMPRDERAGRDDPLAG